MRPVWPLAAALIVTAGCADGSAEGLAGIGPVLVISIDTLRPDYLGTYDSRRATSPHIDRFADDSIVFLDALAQGPGTAISHKSIFYSLYQKGRRTSIRNNEWKIVIDRRRGTTKRILTLSGGEETPWEGPEPKEVRELERAYERMIRSGAELASRFTVTGDNDPASNREAREQLRALGYIE